MAALEAQGCGLLKTTKDSPVKFTTLFAGALLATFAMPLAAQAQGVPGGVEHGFHEGNRRAGPVGAVVGAAVGGVIGGVEGVLGVGPRYYDEEPVYRPRVTHRGRGYHRHSRYKRTKYRTSARRY